MNAQTMSMLTLPKITNTKVNDYSEVSSKEGSTSGVRVRVTGLKFYWEHFHLFSYNSKSSLKQHSVSLSFL